MHHRAQVVTRSKHTLEPLSSAPGCHGGGPTGAAGPQTPPRNQVVPMVRPPSGAISTRPCHGLSGAPYTCSGGPSELGGWVHGCWGQHHRRAHPSNAFCPPHATQVRGRTIGTTPPAYLGTKLWHRASKTNAGAACVRLTPRADAALMLLHSRCPSSRL